MEPTLSQRMDKGLGRYYEHKGVPYFNENGVGKFTEWVDNDGWDTDEITDEFDRKPEDVAFIDFDDDFPTNCSGEEKLEEIFKIIFVCFKDPTAFIKSSDYSLYQYQSISPLQIIKNMHPSKRCLVSGYFLVNFGDNTPFDIIQLTIFFCFILDELEMVSSLKAFNMIATFKLEQSLIISTRNNMKFPGKYHWKFKILNCDDDECRIQFRLTQNNKYFTICDCDLATNDIIHIYVDTKRQIVANHLNLDDPRDFDIEILDDFEEINDCKLQLIISDYSASIELIEYHNSNWCINQLLNNKEDGTAHIEYARCTHDLMEKLEHYLIGIRLNPSMESWNDEYLCYLMYLKQYNKAYQHILKYKNGFDWKCTVFLGKHFFYTKNFEFAYNLWKLLNDEVLNEYDLHFKMAEICKCIENEKLALKHFQSYLNQHINDNTNHYTKRKNLCIQNIALIHYNNNDYPMALSLFLKLDRTTLHRHNLNGNIADCYMELKEYDKALPYFELYINKNPNIWGYRMLSDLFYKKNDTEKARQQLLLALDVVNDEEDKDNLCSIYGRLAMIECHDGNLANSVKYNKMALQHCSDKVGSDRYILNNLGRCLYKMNKYEESLKYLSHGIKKYPHNPYINGNYGILLFYLNRYNEAVIYLEKCIKKKTEMTHLRMMIDALYCLGMILYDKNEFIKSNDKCLKAINCDEFRDYNDKEKFWELMSKNHSNLSEYNEAEQYLLKTKKCNKNNTKTNGRNMKAVPMTYRCFGCGLIGKHWIMNCPLKNIDQNKD